MDVLYDARAEMSARAKFPPLNEWLADYPALAEALEACVHKCLIGFPEGVLKSVPKLCQRLQEGFWFYLDSVYDKDKKHLPKLNQTNFIMLMLEASDDLKEIYTNQKARDDLLSEWRVYMRKVPLNGAVLINRGLNKCVLIQAYKGNAWTFPGGKKDQGEDDVTCATREVLEETGLNIAGKVDPQDYLIADVNNGQLCKLFMVPDIDESVQAKPTTVKEIGKIGWVEFSRLPGWDPDKDSNLRVYGVDPFLEDIRSWVNTHRRSRGWEELAPNSQRLAHAARNPGRGRSRSLGPGAQQFPIGVGHPVPAGRFRGRSPPTGDEGSTGSKSRSAAAAGGNSAQPRGRYQQDNSQARDQGKKGQQRGLFKLDMGKVMHAFDEGWERRAARAAGG